MTKKYSFGIDIDGTVTTPDFLLPYINEAYQTNITLDDVKTYDLTEALAVDKADFFKWFKSEELNMYKNPPIQLNAKRILTNWYPNVSLNYITWS